MSFIPKVRYKKKVTPYGFRNKTPEENGYWQGYMNDSGIEQTLGYDFAADSANDIFHNLEVYQDTLETAIGKEADSIEDLGIDAEIISDDKRLEDYTDDEREAMTLQTRLLLAIKEMLAEHLESDRDEFITGIIDGMDEDEYESIKKLVDSGERQNGYTVDACDESDKEV